MKYMPLFAMLVFSSQVFPALAKGYYADNSFTGVQLGTKANPWNSLDSINNFKRDTARSGFSPGDVIYLKRNTGKLYTGKPVHRGAGLSGILSPQGSGTRQAPITLDAYGTGKNPVIDAKGAQGAAGIFLYDQDHWIIRNMEVTNDVTDQTYDSQGFRWGILVYFPSRTDSMTHCGITIENNYVHNVFGSYCKEPKGIASMYYTGGIYVWCAAGGTTSYDSTTRQNNRMDGVLIGNNWVENIAGQGICFRGESIWDGENDVMNWNNLSTNVVIRGNSIFNVCDGIQPIGTDNVLIERNMVDRAGGMGRKDPMKGGKPDPARHTVAIAGIWPACTRNGVIQYNEVKKSRMLPMDGFAFDNDMVQDGACVFQYNYSHDNEGGFFMETYPEKQDGPEKPKSIVRYNISQNDGLGIQGWPGYQFIVGRGNAEIYNNTIYTAGTVAFMRNPDLPVDSTAAVTVTNNIFYGAKSNWDVLNCLTLSFANNVYYGGLAPPTPSPDNTRWQVDSLKVTTDPQLVDPGKGGSGLGSLQGYILKSNSPCIDAGKTIERNGGISFWGTKLYSGKPDIGAYEFPK
ncbi:MAG: hypothetical protein JW768_10770 [Chitinispirillaceae bacterium]|nr:hypothetical protein [Chitinispirillaceae bacterium]